MIPITIIGGYLGSGKTTLLNRLLREEHGRHLAVLVNDFGSVNIDADLVINRDGETISLANGCICCTLANGMLSTLTGLRDRAVPPEQIVIEASGIADPGKIARYANLPGFSRSGVIVVVDAEQIERQWSDRYLGDTIQRQLRSADLLVLTKTDLLSDEQTASVIAWLRRNCAEPPVVVAKSTLPVSMFLEISGVEHAWDGDRSLDETGYRRHQYSTNEPLNRAWFESMVAQLPESVLRGKGFVCFQDDPDACWVWQLVGRRWSLEPTDRPAANATRLVLIALADHPTQGDFVDWPQPTGPSR